MELFTGYMVRDNLTINFITLIHPVDAIKNWQANAPPMADLNFYLFKLG
jgi:hypothetical protein